MNTKVYHTLEFDKIIDQLTECAASEGAKKLCRELEPMTDRARIEQAQKQTGDAFSRIIRDGELSFAGLENPNAKLRRLEMGGVLNAGELLSIHRMLEVARRAKAYGRKAKEAARDDSLQEAFDALEPLSNLSAEIARCILSEEEIADDASSKLHQIRRGMRGINGRVHTALNQIINSMAGKMYLQEPIVTMRNGRYCLPVKAEYKMQVQGMVHDQSSSGSTLFIEPMAVVRLNNELKEAQLEEEKEIERILADLSSQAAEQAAIIEADYRVLMMLDFIFAKARLAWKQNGMAPTFNDTHQIRIRRGRHPLIPSKQVVPIDVALGGEFDLLIVTGPNTGGKTVSLKTVGLFCLMGQAGLHIPAADHTELGIFDEIFADIGDEQSIEQNLSTFSSHMTNIVSILKKADENTLVLFDELCAGTDPTEGAALAISILDDLRVRRVHTMATTHYSELKLYALETKRVENACCEFDVETLSPTYRLLMGIPGKSNAFAISQKLGIASYLIDSAKMRMSHESKRFEDIIADLEQDRVAMERERLQAETYKREAEEIRAKAEEKQRKLEESRDRILREANAQAAAILKEAKDTADETIRNFRKYGKEGMDAAAMERERDKVRRKMNESGQKAGGFAQQKTGNVTARDLRLGDDVRIISLNLRGTVHTLPNAKGKVMVQAGIMRYETDIRDLERIAEPAEDKNKTARKSSMGKLSMSKSSSISPELNLIGKHVDEALQLMDKYLDDAYLAHLPSVRIVHGKGTGALRSAIHNDLKLQPIVKSYRLGEHGEGDVGVTIVELK